MCVFISKITGKWWLGIDYAQEINEELCHFPFACVWNRCAHCWLRIIPNRVLSVYNNLIPVVPDPDNRTHTDTHTRVCGQPQNTRAALSAWAVICQMTQLRITREPKYSSSTLLFHRQQYIFNPVVVDLTDNSVGNDRVTWLFKEIISCVFVTFCKL